MKQTMNRWMSQWVVGACVAALLTAVAVPHRHDHTNASHPPTTCRACKIQESFAATLPTAPVEALVVAWSSHRLPQIDRQAPRTLQLHSSFSRAPPRSS